MEEQKSPDMLLRTSDAVDMGLGSMVEHIELADPVEEQLLQHDTTILERDERDSSYYQKKDDRPKDSLLTDNSMKHEGEYRDSEVVKQDANNISIQEKLNESNNSAIGSNRTQAMNS